MGLWGAAQAFAFGIGGFLGTLASDIARHLLSSPALSYAAVFAPKQACSWSPPGWRSGSVARKAVEANEPDAIADLRTVIAGG